MKKAFFIILAIAVTTLCLFGCVDTDIDIVGVWNIDTVSNDSGKLIAVGEAHIGDIDLPRKNIECEVKTDGVIEFRENAETVSHGTYTAAVIDNAKLLHVSMENGKLFDITCGEKYVDGKKTELTMIFEYETYIITFSKKSI